MPSATATDVHRTILAALNALVPVQGPPTTQKPFAAVIEVTEPLTKNNLPAWANAQFPCALVYFAQSRADVDAETLGGGDFEMLERSRWIISVAVEDVRDESNATIGATGVPGALPLSSAVKLALNGIKVAVPPASLLFQVNGQLGETDPLDARARLQFTLNGGVVEFQLEGDSLTYGADPGYVSVVGTCTTPGVLGNLAVGMQGVWNEFQPAHAFAATVANVESKGAFATLRNRGLWFREQQPGPVERGSFYALALTFECDTAAEQWTPLDESRPLGPINGNVNVTDSNGAETPFVSFRANTQT